ncbi:MAG: rRNA maturation RNase YbeY [Cyanobium sp.]
MLQAAGVWLDPLQGEQAWQELLVHWLTQLLPELPAALRSGAYSLGLGLVDDGEIASLNSDWRGSAGPTDVLAFAAQDGDLEEATQLSRPGWMAAGPAATDSPENAIPGAASDPDRARSAAADLDDDSPDDPLDLGGMPLELGDIVISVETAARQAPEQGHSLERELLFLASHGLLHLLGWDHPDDARLAMMLARQEALLATMPTGLPAPSRSR